MSNGGLGSPLLAVEDLEVCFATEHGMVPVVHGLSFDVGAGEIVGLVGESGCGKSVTSLAIMRLIPNPPGRITAGRILFEGGDLLSLPEREMRALRGNRISMIFQEPMTSLDPAFKVGEQIASAVRHHRGVSKAAAWERAIEALDLVGIPSARQRARDYPHMFSGGMQQRVMIAIALACDPAVLIADEPTTSLDVTIQAQVLDLLRSLQQDLGMAVIFVTHDLGVVSALCDRVVVMYAGQAVERAPTDQLFAQPGHPYTEGLLECLPAEHAGEKLQPIPGTVPPVDDMPPGCLFHPRCRYCVSGRCDQEPVPFVLLSPDRAARCVRVNELALAGIDP
jgi:oligopeptide/dipeptide ABC transporter ATP-binding protein